MDIALIAAVAQNGIIGRDNKMPWYLPNDLKFFKATTMGKPIIMGRKTFDSLGKALPGRRNIVITRNDDYDADDIVVVKSLEEAIELASSIAHIDGMGEIMVIGGGEIYKQALPLATRLYLTEVHADVEGDASFPEWPKDQFEEITRESYKAEGPNPYDYSFVIYRKK